MSEIVPINTQALVASASDRKLGRALARLERNAAMEVAHVRAVEVVESAKVEAIEAVAHAAMSSAAALSAAERFHAERDSHASARVNLIAHGATITLTRRIELLNRRLG